MLREWQREIIRGIYDPVDERGKRLKRRVLITMARKNAKTTLIAALVLVHLVGPESRRRQKIYSAANDREQASEVYDAAAAMVEADEDLSRLVRPIPSRKRLVCHFNGSFYMALSADAKTKHGKNPALWIYDELAQAQNTALYDALDTSQGAQDEPLGIVISTQATDPKALMSELVEDARRVLAGLAEDATLAAFIFEVPKDADPFDESLWTLANPALGDFCSLTEMRAAAAKAKRLPSRLNVFRNLNLNQQVDGIAHLIGPEDWKACGATFDMESLRRRRCWAGLDLSKRCDLSALVLVFEPALDDGPMPVLVRVWSPEKDLAERSLKDKAHYPVWVEQGHMIAVPGATIRYEFVAREIAALHAQYDLQGIAYDRWRIDLLKDALDAEGIEHFIDTGKQEDSIPGAVRLVKWGQGFRDMGFAVDQIEEDILERRIAHAMHPVLTWAASNTVASHDAAGNRKPDKQKARNRIDPFVALVMANGLRAVLGTKVYEPPQYQLLIF